MAKNGNFIRISSYDWNFIVKSTNTTINIFGTLVHIFQIYLSFVGLCKYNAPR